MATSVLARITDAPDDIERPAPRPTPSQIIAEGRINHQRGA